MNYSDTIEKIRRLAQGEDVCDDALCKLLLDSITFFLSFLFRKGISY